MKNSDPFSDQKLEQLQLSVYLLPMVGWLFGLWTIYTHRGSREEQAVSRLSVTLALMWLISYSCLSLGAAQTTDVLTIRLSYLNALLTSGYFLVSLILTLRVWQGKSARLPGVKINRRG